jgi:hypothetical protein
VLPSNAELIRERIASREHHATTPSALPRNAGTVTEEAGDLDPERITRGRMKMSWDAFTNLKRRECIAKCTNSMNPPVVGRDKRQITKANPSLNAIRLAVALGGR